MVVFCLYLITVQKTVKQGRLQRGSFRPYTHIRLNPHLNIKYTETLFILVCDQHTSKDTMHDKV